ncbi:hypothetical protein ACG7TL_007565 [Trametes sanguinea]
MLEVFVHRFPAAPLNSDSPYGDCARLAVLGSRVLDAVFADVLFVWRPMLPADDMGKHASKLREGVNEWVEGYGWWAKVRCSPETELKTLKEGVLFDSYVGAVFAREGYKAVRDWIGALVGEAPTFAQQELCAEPEQKGHNLGHGLQCTGILWYHLRLPFLTYPVIISLPDSPTQPFFPSSIKRRNNVVSLCSTLHSSWVLNMRDAGLYINGLEKGIGTAASKQLAKEAAARQAYHVMGWAPRT